MSSTHRMPESAKRVRGEMLSIVESKMANPGSPGVQAVLRDHTEQVDARWYEVGRRLAEWRTRLLEAVD